MQAEVGVHLPFSAVHDNGPMSPARPSVLHRLRLTRLCGLLALTLAVASPAVGARERSDHERALQAVQAGEILPLPRVLERVGREQPGQVLAIELEQENGRWIYELKLLQPDGRLLKLDVDARDASILRRRPR